MLSRGQRISLSRAGAELRCVSLDVLPTQMLCNGISNSVLHGVMVQQLDVQLSDHESPIDLWVRNAFQHESCHNSETQPWRTYEQEELKYLDLLKNKRDKIPPPPTKEQQQRETFSQLHKTITSTQSRSHPIFQVELLSHYFDMACSWDCCHRFSTHVFMTMSILLPTKLDNTKVFLGTR